MRPAAKIGLGAAALTGAGVLASQVLSGRSHYEGPRYTVAERTGPFELRQYEPRLLAETRVDLPFDQAISEGFRRLARYIFGGNARRAPVAMTTPVEAHQDGGWIVRFTMPSRETPATLPAPEDARIQLRAETGRQVAAVRFAGRATERKAREAEARLRAWLATRALSPAGPALLAQYDPPWTLPFLRRNEVLLPILLAPVPLH